MQVQSVSSKQPVTQKTSTAKKIAGFAGKTVVSAGVGVLAGAKKLGKLPQAEQENLVHAFFAKSNKEAYTEFGKYVVEKGNQILKECGHQPPKGTPAELVEKAYERAISTYNTMGKSIGKSVTKTMAVAVVATFAAISGASAIIKGVKAHKANAQDK